MTVLGKDGILLNVLESSIVESRKLENFLTEADALDGVLGSTLIGFRNTENMTIDDNELDLHQLYAKFLDLVTDQGKSSIESFASEIPTLDIDDLIKSVELVNEVVTIVLVTDTRDSHLAAIAIAVQNFICEIASATTELQTQRSGISSEVIDALAITLLKVVAGVTGIVGELFLPISDDVGVIGEALLDILVVIVADSNDIVESIVQSLVGDSDASGSVVDVIQSLSKMVEEPVERLTRLALNV